LVPAAPDPAVTYRGLTYRCERLANIARELPPLFERHHHELAVDPDRAPLDVDWDRYFDYDLLGVLRILTVRDGPMLVGYVFNLVGPHMHKKSTRWAHVDLYWLDPAYRIGLTGYRMFVENEKLAKACGAQKITVAEKCHFKNDFGRQVNLIFKRLGYAPEDVVHGKWIGD
jgi:hypothetical protein